MMTLGGFLRELVEACRAWLMLPGGELGPAWVTTPSRTAFSSRLIFQVSISSSSMGVAPLLKSGSRPWRYLTHIRMAAMISRTATTERTELSVTMSVRLLARLDEPLLSGSVDLGVSVVVAEVDDRC
jgi:hypothetical protein